MEFAYLKESRAAEVLKTTPIAILPVGAVEVHGNHLPLCTDTLLAEGVAQKVCERLENAVILPSIGYGQVWSLADFPGCINIPNDILAGMIAAIGESLHKSGVRKLAVINGHVGNATAIKQASRMIYDKCDLKTYCFTYPGAEEAIGRVCTSKRPHKTYFHACEIETSYMLYLAPEHVDMSRAISNYPAFPEDFDVTPSPWSAVMNTAVMGDATAASAEKGQAIIDAVVEKICRILTLQAGGGGRE